MYTERDSDLWQSLRYRLSDRCSGYTLLSSSVSRANLHCVVATISYSLAFLLPSPWPTRAVWKLRHSPVLLFFLLRLPAYLRCLLATTFSSFSFLSNSPSSPSFNLLTRARCFFSWSSVSDNLFISYYGYFGSPSCSIFYASYIQPIFALFFILFALNFSFLSERFFCPLHC